MNAKFIGYLVEGGSMDFHGVHTEEKVDRATTFLVSGTRKCHFPDVLQGTVS